MYPQTLFGTVGTVGTDSGHEAVSPYAQDQSWGISVPTVPTVPTSIATLVDECDSLGIELWADGDQIRYRGPKGVVTGELAGRLRTHKAEVLALLAPSRPTIFPDRWGPGVDDGVGSIVMPVECWRWSVANWPLPAWKAWRRLADELAPDEATAAEILEAQELAYRRLAGTPV